jgi:predicted phosphodiesterase
MTRWAFVSDIHGNRQALANAQGLAQDRGVDHFVCLGDVIGRGDPESCVAWVHEHAQLAIVGNRDLDYLSRVPLPMQDVVRTWTNEVRASDFVASHGEPRLHRTLSSAAERDGFRRARQYMRDIGAAIWFFGHTHRSRAWKLAGEDPSELLGNNMLRADAGALYVVNVGTTGLPLPGRGPASFVIYDDVDRLVERVALETGAIVRGVPARSAPRHV